MTDINKQEQFIELRAKGMSFAKISEQLGISKPTLIKLSREFKIDIDNMRRIEQEALREKYLISKEKQLEQLVNHFEKVQQELAKRDLSDIPTERLFNLNDKLLQEMNSERALYFTRKYSDIELDFSKTETWTV